MMSPSTLPWQETFASKIVTPAKAVGLIPRGRRILIGSGAAEPNRLVEAMVAEGDHLADNEVVHLLTLGPAPYVRPGMQHRFRHTAFFIGENVREAVRVFKARGGIIRMLPPETEPPRRMVGWLYGVYELIYEREHQ